MFRAVKSRENPPQAVPSRRGEQKEVVSNCLSCHAVKHVLLGKILTWSMNDSDNLSATSQWIGNIGSDGPGELEREHFV